MSHVLTIIWDFAPEIFSNLNVPVLGNIRWYGVLWAIAFIIGHYILDKVYKIENRKAAELDSLFIYVLLGSILGARLGHCLFYDPIYYLSNPLEILMIQNGGLASHGGGFGLIIASYIFYKKHKLPSFPWILDKIVLTVALAGALIRFGNYLNSEIIGIPTDSAFSVAFVNSAEQILNEPTLYNGAIESIDYQRVEGDTVYHGAKMPKYKMTFHFDPSVNFEANKENIFQTLALYNYEERSDNRHFIINKDTPQISGETVSQEVYLITRHPSQLYEASSSFIVFVLLMYLYFIKYRDKIPDGLLFGIFLVWTFTLRFIYEFYKENQEAHESGWTLNTGQWLSIPMVLIGSYFLIKAFQTKKNDSLPEN